MQVALPLNKPTQEAEEITDYRIQLSFDGRSDKQDDNPCAVANQGRTTGLTAGR